MYAGSLKMYAVQLAFYRHTLQQNAVESTSMPKINPENLKKLREHKGFSQAKLASEIGVNKQSIYRYESDDPPVARQKQFEKLCKVLGCSAAMLSGTEPIPQSDAAGLHLKTGPIDACQLNVRT